jgi:hypothetical protein
MVIRALYNTDPTVILKRDTAKRISNFKFLLPFPAVASILLTPV